MRIFTLLFAVLVGLAPAKAADVYNSTKDSPAYVVPSDVAVSTQSWTSIWVAALAGYSMSNTDLGLDYLTRGEGEGDSRWENLGRVDGFGGQGWDGTLQIGGDIEVRGIVAGVFGEYSFGGTESSASLGDFAKLDVEQQDSYCLLGRLGVARGDTLFYGASGWCHTEFEATVHLGEGSATKSFEFDGVPLELGVEHRFTSNIRGRLSGRYTWYGEETVLGGGDDDGGRLTAEPGIFALKAGIVISTGGAFSPLR